MPQILHFPQLLGGGEGDEQYGGVPEFAQLLGLFWREFFSDKQSCSFIASASGVLKDSLSLSLVIENPTPKQSSDIGYVVEMLTPDY